MEKQSNGKDEPKKFHSVFEGCVNLRLLQMTIFKIPGLV